MQVAEAADEIAIFMSKTKRLHHGSWIPGNTIDNVVDVAQHSRVTVYEEDDVVISQAPYVELRVRISHVRRL